MEGDSRASEWAEPDDTGGLDELLDSLTTSNGRVATRLTGGAMSSQSRGVLIGVLVGLGIAAVVGSLILSWVALSRSTSDATADGGRTITEADGEAAAADSPQLAQVEAILAALGIDGVVAEQRGSTTFLSGSVASQGERDAAVEAIGAVVGGELDTSGLIVSSPAPTGSADTANSDPAPSQRDPRSDALRSELQRITASTPIIFDRGAGEISELHRRILNEVAIAILAYPDVPVTIVGYTDSAGDEAANTQLSLSRAGSVQSYLVAQGVPAGRLQIDAKGEAGASGSDDLAGLERRVEFEVDSAAGAPVPDSRETLRIALVAPSASNDLAFTQSMVDAINVIAAERGNVEVDITDNTFVPAEAADAIRSYAAADYDLIIAHGVEFGNELRAIVTDNPGVTFGWGTASDTFGLPNLYAYDAAAEEGGYVMGAMSAMLSTSDVIGVVGPIQVADAERYIDGFDAGVRAQAPSSKVLIEYTGSFADITLAAEVAERHVGAGADVMTGTAEMVVGAVSVASEHDVLWFGTQASQAPMAPNIVVASQVYHWEVALRPIVADIDAGTREGRSYLAQLSNGGLVIELNPDYQLPVDVRQRANDITADIISGRIRP